MNRYKYAPLPGLELQVQSEVGTEGEALEALNRAATQTSRRRKSLLVFSMATVLIVGAWYAASAWAAAIPGCDAHVCDTPARGFECHTSISHHWGQYSPFFSVPSDIDPSIPGECTVTFAQVLSRHGARFPTTSNSKNYNSTVSRIKSTVKKYGAGYEFLGSYIYNLGAEDLTIFGQNEMINSGIKFYDRYEALAKTVSPFIRSSGQDRVVVSAKNFTQGFHQSRLTDTGKSDAYPYNFLIIPEANGVNNTLNHVLCTQFENGTDSKFGGNAQSAWTSVFLPNITARVNANLPGANISATETIYLMDLCPFNTVADVNGALSPFCNLFTDDEWKLYDYYETLGKWYGYGSGNPLGPTQGVGFTNELIARLTNTSVVDHTSTNTTLDSSAATFPLGAKLYADFSHDNDMTGIFAAMGLYNATSQLSNSTYESAAKANGYSAAYTVPFGARAYFEKMTCTDVANAGKGELVRVLVNDRVVPLQGCGADSLGRCKLADFVASLGFARSGGLWNQCFTGK